MAKKAERNLIVALDIGTSKVAALVGEVNANGSIEVIGLGTSPSKGLKRGVVVNLESTVQSIQKAVEEAELMAGCQIVSVFAGIAGSHIKSLNSHGVVAIKDKGEVTQYDIDRVIDSARTVALPADQGILHILPQKFRIDGQEGIKDPKGMSGIRMEAKVHIVTGNVSALQNITNCIRRCNLHVDDIVLEQLASCYSVLTEDEKDLGVCLIDIGGGTTDIAIYVDGGLKHTAVIPIAGDQVTNDIAVALRTPTANAEEIKRNHACALTQMAAVDGVIEVPSIGDRPPRKISMQSLSEIIEPRYAELLVLVEEELQHSGLKPMIRGGIVLTGGSSKAKGLVELAEEILHKSVRLGGPEHVMGLAEVVKNPIYSTAAGLLLYGKEHEAGNITAAGKTSWFEKIKNWFVGNL